MGATGRVTITPGPANGDRTHEPKQPSLPTRAATISHPQPIVTARRNGHSTTTPSDSKTHQRLLAADHHGCRLLSQPSRCSSSPVENPPVAVSMAVRSQPSPTICSNLVTMGTARSAAFGQISSKDMTEGTNMT
ncbi:hypothetical protein ACLOJK_012452 [Asimina triloba]